MGVAAGAVVVSPYIAATGRATFQLPEALVARYARREPAWGPLGRLVYLRSYSRWLPELRRRERWSETVRRVVEYSLSLDRVSADTDRLGEAERLFDLIFHLRGFPAGRSLWIAGTAHADRFPQANLNSAFTNVTCVNDLHDGALLLMNGCGVGFGLRQEQVDAFRTQGALRPARSVSVAPYRYVGRPGTLDHTVTASHPGRPNSAVIRVGDSIQGWAGFVRNFVRAFLFGGLEEIVVDLSAVRPAGERLVQFGGTASGPGSVEEFTRSVVRLFAHADRINDAHLLDIVNLIGRMAARGGARRSAQIVIGDPSATAFVRAKTGDWHRTHPWRAHSNNSVVFEERPARAELMRLFDAILECGEPGFINGGAARERHPEWAGFNSCAEVILPDGGSCNLVTINLGRLAASGEIDVEQLLDDYAAIVRHSVRMTLLPLPGMQDKWDRARETTRPLGVSFTGYGDFVAAFGDDPAERTLRTLRDHGRSVARSYARQLGTPEPLLVTTVKPEGTLSNLPGVSSGIHDAYAPYYIRRIRMSERDPVALALQAKGVPCEPDHFEPTALVFDFPVRTNAVRAAQATSATDQLARYFRVMRAYVDHNASNTIYLGEHEVAAVIDLLIDRWDEYVAVSFLPKTAAPSHPQMPYEEIDRDTWERLAARMPDLADLTPLVEAFESRSTS